MDFGYNFPSRTDRRSATGATPWSRPSCICKCVPCTPGVDSVIGWRDGEGMGGRWAWSSHSNPVSMVPLNQKCQLLPWVFPPFLAISDWLPAVANFILKQTTENARGRPILWWELLEGCQGFGWWNPPLLISNLLVASTRDADLNHLRALSSPPGASLPAPATPLAQCWERSDWCSARRMAKATWAAW